MRIWFRTKDGVFRGGTYPEPEAWNKIFWALTNLDSVKSWGYVKEKHETH